MQMKDSSDQIRQRNAREVKPTLSKEILRQTPRSANLEKVQEQFCAEKLTTI